MNHAPVSAKVLDAAIDWQLRLDSGAASEHERGEFSIWLAAHSEHARAWAQLGGLDHRLAGASSLAARRALLRTPNKKRTARASGLLGLVLGSALALGLLNQQRPLTDWLADIVTGSGEQREVQLPDRTRVRLNSRSALDIDFNPTQRRLFLRSGEILVETAHGDVRPFVVGTPEGDLRALGTRFLVRREAQGTRLIVLQSAVAAHPLAAPDERIVTEGQQVLMHAATLEASQPAPLAADAWTRGMLVAENMRLAELLAQLSEYRDGYLGVDPRIADLRISGSFPLHDSELALAALPPSLPVRIERHTRWWVKVAPVESSQSR
ncbi:FecR family protein [Pseudomonas sp. LS44]|uniref:FecR family protein n=1 Tax=Pseudomonas sp. LS44 TaxID=1357074 RepID=UPI00215A762D|nr:FecR family protein [Pseudomonas sp. LS44]UVE18182.1 FecR family protein [Pseudomonas sp. LS44]